jgi:hypothetical protein
MHYLLIYRKLLIAYGTVNSGHSIGLSNKFLRNIQCIHSKPKATIRTNSGMSSERSTNSVLQGETLSPKLFTLFVEDIVSFFKKSGIAYIKLGKAEIDILLYADHMVILAYNAIDLQQKI